MDYSIILEKYGIPIIMATAGWYLGRGKNKAETKKLQAETELIYSQKYAEDLEATKAFRELLVADNAGLVKEIREMKIRYEITTISFKEQIADLTRQLSDIMNDREYSKCKGEKCEIAIAYKKIMDTRAKRKKKTPPTVIE